MARTIRVADIGDYAQQQYEKLLRVAVLETDRRVKESSPVDLGRFRLSWAIGQNAAPFQGVPEGDYRGQPVPPPRAVNYTFGTERMGNIYSVHNNLPYAEKLAIAPPGFGVNEKEKRYNPYREVKNWASPGGGSSIQTDGPGWVQQIAKDIQGFVRVNADRIGRQS
jgi:hypothetical protein